MTASSSVEPRIVSRADQLRREAMVALNALLDGLERAKAWDLLQERDEDDIPRGPMPYTDAAIEAFEKLHASHPNDTSMRHHLAIAHHAKAWDLELGGRSEDAAPEWRIALAHWQELVASSGFWEGMKDKLRLCQADADPAILDHLRSDLLEDLLQIHVDFIRHHCELGRREKAVAHVRIVQTARIRPALRKKFIHKVFEAMTSSVPQAQAQNDYQSALVYVEQFLELFGDRAYYPALKLHTELCGGWARLLCTRSEWDQIMSLSDRAQPVVEELLKVLETQNDPAGVNAMEDVCFWLTRGLYERALTLRPAEVDGEFDDERLKDFIDAHELPSKWGRMYVAQSRQGAPIRGLFAGILHSCACALRARSVTIYNRACSSTSLSDSIRDAMRRDAVQICREAVGLLEEAVNWDPNDTDLSDNLEKFRDDLDHIDG